MKKLKRKYERHHCLESINSMYVELGNDGYNIKPCCLYKNEHNKQSVDTIQELLDNPVINNIREKFKGNWRKQSECQICIQKEKLDLPTKRKRSLQSGYNGYIVNWDLRPGNTCNLKCAMCNYGNSSKWAEDKDIEEKYNSHGYKYSTKTTREDLDWDWIYSQVIDKAESIYFAGGEPFYMKNVYKFLVELSKNEWNCKNTRIKIQTNGVSNTPKLMNVLAKFKKRNFTISVDGWGEVNELIRFPTNHNTFITMTDEINSLCDTRDGFGFSITVQAMNLPNIDTLVNNLKDRWGDAPNFSIDMHNLSWPNFLQINALKPHVIDNVMANTSIEEVKQYCNQYEYNSVLNGVMQNYLLDLDAKRGTDSKRIMGWCFE